MREKSEYISEQVAALAAIFVTQAQVGEQNLKKNKTKQFKRRRKSFLQSVYLSFTSNFGVYLLCSCCAMPTIESAMADDIDDVDAMLEDVFNKKVRGRLNMYWESIW